MIRSASAVLSLRCSRAHRRTTSQKPLSTSNTKPQTSFPHATFLYFPTVDQSINASPQISSRRAALALKTLQLLFRMFHSAWQNRLKLIIGPVGYQSYMRRSLQTVILFEAKRCISPRLSTLRPFQKRALLMTTVNHILREIDFLTASEKEAVLWKTQRRQEQLDDATAWKRCKIVERELVKLCQQLTRYIEPTRTHQLSVNMLVQELYVSRWETSALLLPHPVPLHACLSDTHTCFSLILFSFLLLSPGSSPSWYIRQMYLLSIPFFLNCC